MKQVVFAIVFLMLILWMFSTFIPRSSQNYTYMLRIKSTTLKFCNKYNRVPKNIIELKNAYPNMIEKNDVWGNEFQYVVTGMTVSIVSYAEDGLPGGEDESADYRGVIVGKDKNGNWHNEETRWYIDPFKGR